MLYGELRSVAGVGDEAWNDLDNPTAISFKRVDFWAQRAVNDLAWGEYTFKFFQKDAKTANLTPDAYDLTIKTTTDGKAIELPENVGRIICGKVGDKWLSSQSRGDIFRLYSEDVDPSVVFCWISHNNNQKNPKTIIRFSNNYSTSTIQLIVEEIPKDLSLFPADFYDYFLADLAERALRIKQASSLDGVRSDFVKAKQAAKVRLLAHYATKYEPNLMKPLPYGADTHYDLVQGECK
jgi:hypothetical protein